MNPEQPSEKLGQRVREETEKELTRLLETVSCAHDAYERLVHDLSETGGQPHPTKRILNVTRGVPCNAA